VTIFVSSMKKYSHIFLSLLLSMTILYFGSGVNILRCAHTGTVKVLTAIGAAEMSGMSCGMNSSCMSMERVELSPTIMAQTVVYDFHAVQPLLAVLPSLVSAWFPTTTEHKTYVQPHFVVWKSPPRAYLNYIQVLQI